MTIYLALIWVYSAIGYRAHTLGFELDAAVLGVRRNDATSAGTNSAKARCTEAKEQEDDDRIRCCTINDTHTGRIILRFKKIFTLGNKLFSDAFVIFRPPHQTLTTVHFTSLPSFGRNDSHLMLLRVSQQ